MNILKSVRMSLTLALFAAAACTNGNGKTSEPGQSAYASNPYNFRLSLTDAPNEDLKAVVVNVKHAELRVEGGGKAARLIVAENLGAVNLLDLQNGVLLPIADLTLPQSVTITQIRLVLDSAGNYILKGDESRCDLQTPSAQKIGVKLLIHQGVTIENGYNYSIVADFDAKKSIVLQGNGGCLLKPVIKLKSATRISVPDDSGGSVGEEPGDDGTDTPAEEPVIPEDGGSQETDDGSGFDSGPDITVPTVPVEDVPEYFSDL